MWDLNPINDRTSEKTWETKNSIQKIFLLSYAIYTGLSYTVETSDLEDNIASQCSEKITNSARSPLVQASDAVVIDCTGLNLEEIIAKIRERVGACPTKLRKSKVGGYR